MAKQTAYMPGDDRRIGITTTIPIEPLLAAGLTPVDLNNLFIGSGRANELVAIAERDGFPRTTCSWIKGIYGAVMEAGIPAVVEVVQGDCDDGRALCRVLAARGVRIIKFAYPSEPVEEDVAGEIEYLCAQIGVSFDEAAGVYEGLKGARLAALEVDRASWARGNGCSVSASAVSRCLVSTSDLNGDADEHERSSRMLLQEAVEVPPRDKAVRLALLGVPPIMDDLCETVETFGGRIVFHEVPYQFCLPAVAEGAGFSRAYADYTYPYGIEYRLRGIEKELSRRRVNGVIHYVQTFCHRQIEDMLVHERIDLPVLTVEGDAPGPVDARTKLRLEAFLAGLKRRREGAADG